MKEVNFTSPANLKSTWYRRKWIMALTAAFLLSIIQISSAQTGYIYVHKKALNENQSLDFTFSITGGSGTTVVPNFTLNDQPDQNSVRDLGSSQNGRLWTVTADNTVWYRNAGSSTWIHTNITDASRIDGGPGGTAYYIADGFIYQTDGTTSTAISARIYPTDIGSGWNNTQPYIIISGVLQRYSGSGLNWNTVYINSPEILTYVDVNPVTNDAYVVASGNFSNTRVLKVTPAGVATNLGRPASTDGIYTMRDVAVTATGRVFATLIYNATPGGWYTFEWLSSTTWSAPELASFDVSNLTGGIGDQVWSTMNGGGWSDFTYPYFNIFTRTQNSTSIGWIDDERVRSSSTGNSIMIPVAPGTYTLTETVPGGWDLQKISVFDPSSNSTSNQVANTATINVANGEVVNVVYQNGALNPVAMTNNCSIAYLETFGTTATGTFGSPISGQTTYHLLTDITPAEDGYYKIVSKGSDFNSWPSATNVIDHTPGDGTIGRMLAVNAGYDKGEFFRRRFTGVVPGATYNFSAWITDLTPLSDVNVNVSFSVYDHTTQALIGTYSTGDLLGTTVPSPWLQYGFSFSATSSDIDLVLSNNGLGGNGNDLAIDDISFSLMAPVTPVNTVVNTGCGTLGSITVTLPTGSSYEYSKDGFTTAPQSSPVFNNLTPGVYTISARFAGTVGCITPKVEMVGAAICGNIWNDANGNAVNTAENPVTGIWVNLVNPVTHAVLQSVQVDVSGNYNFTGLPTNTAYQIILSTTIQTGNTNLTSATLPVGYVATGTNLSNTPSTANTTSVINVNTGAGGLTVQNFGLERVPDTDPKTQNVLYPTGGIILPGSVYTAVSGTDAEDGTLGNGNTFIIKSLPTNATIFYDFDGPGGSAPVAVTVGTQITGFNPAYLSYTGITNGSTSVVFNYAFIDAAGKEDPTPAPYTVKWFIALPITLEKFTAIATDCNNVALNWTISDAINFSHFKIERSKDGNSFQKVTTISYETGRTIYTFNDNNVAPGKYQYRLKMVDIDGKIKYSSVIFVRLECNQKQLLLFPNPAKDNVNISGLKSTDLIQLYDINGKLLINKKASGYQEGIGLNKYASGTYMVLVKNTNGEILLHVKLIKTE